MWGAVPIAEEDRHFLIDSANVHRTMWARGRLVPAHLARDHDHPNFLSIVAVLELEGISLENDGHAVKGVDVPAHSFAGLHSEAAHERRPPLEKNLLTHGSDYARPYGTNLESKREFEKYPRHPAPVMYEDIADTFHDIKDNFRLAVGL